MKNLLQDDDIKYYMEVTWIVFCWNLTEMVRRFSYSLWSIIIEYAIDD